MVNHHDTGSLQSAIFGTLKVLGSNPAFPLCGLAVRLLNEAKSFNITYLKIPSPLEGI
jgi:hypothetical protein